jgi:hypothetical protein
MKIPSIVTPLNCDSILRPQEEVLGMVWMLALEASGPMSAPGFLPNPYFSCMNPLKYLVAVYAKQDAYI